MLKFLLTVLHIFLAGSMSSALGQLQILIRYCLGSAIESVLSALTGGSHQHVLPGRARQLAMEGRGRGVWIAASDRVFCILHV